MKEQKETKEEHSREETYKLTNKNMAKKRFPTLAVILLVFSLTWLLNELNVVNLDIPWIPTILSLIAIGWIVDRYVEN